MQVLKLHLVIYLYNLFLF